MYSLNNNIINNKYKIAHQTRLFCPETQLAQITRKIWNPKIWGFLHQKALYCKNKYQQCEQKMKLRSRLTK
jgi:hypothetical protein